MLRKTFHIADMHCTNCVMHLEALVEDIAGILKIQGSYQKQRLVVDFNETIVGEAQIRSAIEMLGYTAE